MKGAIVKRKNGYDIIFLDEETRKILDIFEVTDVEFYENIENFEKTLNYQEKEKEI